MTAPLWTTDPPTPARLGALRRAGFPQLHHVLGHDLSRLAVPLLSGPRIQLYDSDDRQARLWVDTVRLSDHFYRALCDHPVPISEPALRQIANDSPAIDVYIWLAYRLHALERPTPVSWAALHQQFGAGYAQVRQFRARFLPTLREALAVYPDAQVDVHGDGITLHPSHPPVPERTLRLL